MTTAAKQQLRSSPKQQAGFGSGLAARANANATARSPPPILHRKHFASPAPASPLPPAANVPQLPVYGSHNPQRVRFMSSEQSVASADASGQVHLMAGAGSVASSSAMSSSGDGRENVFDRVLNMVMAEEHERLNAMGMGGADPKSDAAAVRLSRKAAQKKAKERFSKADAKARAAVAAAVGDSASGSDDDLGLIPPNRMALAPIDIDTGLEIGGSYDAPIDMDSGLEVHHTSPIDMDTGLEVEYHDLNDDEVDDERWKRLNEKALTTGMQELTMDKDRRCRSYDTGQQQKPPSSMRHNRGTSSGSDPVNYQRSNSGSAEAGAVPPPKKSPGRKYGKKTKKFWDKNRDLQSDEWVAFDNQGRRREGSGNKATSSPGRVSDLAAF